MGPFLIYFGSTIVDNLFYFDESKVRDLERQ